jgi:2-aminoadipate transaminase
MDWNSVLEHADRRLRSSAIRDLLAVTAQRQVISFAGGMPAPECFPGEALRRSFDAVLSAEPGTALQYGPTEGYLPFRAVIAERLGARGIRAGAEDVLITSGSQQGLDLLGKVLLSRGDTLLVFATREIRVRPVALDQDGLVVEEVARALQGADEQHRLPGGGPPRLLYTVPTFQNPSGVTMSPERRTALLETGSRYGLPIVEDDPYGELRYEGVDLPPLRALPGGEDVVYMGTASKILAPGLRIGWIVAPRPLLRRLVLAKQAADLHTMIWHRSWRPYALPIAHAGMRCSRHSRSTSPPEPPGLGPKAACLSG